MSDDEALHNIAENVLRLRGNRSQYWLAKAVDTYPANIARIETAQSMPGAGLLSRLAEALEVTIDELIRDPKNTSRKS